MKRRLKEESVIFVSVVKWLVLATVIGIIVGLSTAAFLKILHLSIDAVTGYGYYFILLPLALYVSTLIVRRLAPEAEGHGTEKVIEAVHKRSGRIKAAVVPVKLTATLVTLAFGGSAGKEGPCAQIGAGLSSIFASLFRFDENDRKKLVICGISGGFAAVFGTPIAGAIFGMEVLFVGAMLYDVLLPSFVAGIISYQVSSSLGITYFYYPLEFVPHFSEAFFLKVVAAGIFFGLCSFLLIEALNLGKKYAGKLEMPETRKALLGGLMLVVLSLIFSTRYLGLGLETIHSTLEGGEIPWYSVFAKMLFTSITLNFGGSGGIVTPIFFIGASSGNLFARIMGLDTAMFAAIGLVSLLAGAANTPIAASIMAVELFGPKVAPFAAVSIVISFLMTGHRSVYPSQVLAIRKSSSIHVDLGKEMEIIRARYRYRDRSVIGGILKALKEVEQKGRLEERPEETAKNSEAGAAGEEKGP